MIDTEPYRVAAGSMIDLEARSTRNDGGLDKEEGKKAVKKLSKRLIDL